MSYQMVHVIQTHSDLAAQLPARLAEDPPRTLHTHGHGRSCSSPRQHRPCLSLLTGSATSVQESGASLVKLHFIPHLPVTGVKNSGISSCSTLVLSDAMTRTRSTTLSGSAPGGVKRWAVCSSVWEIYNTVSHNFDFSF